VPILILQNLSSDIIGWLLRVWSRFDMSPATKAFSPVPGAGVWLAVQPLFGV
jgi:hypothetical protein